MLDSTVETCLRASLRSLWKKFIHFLHFFCELLVLGTLLFGVWVLLEEHRSSWIRWEITSHLLDWFTYAALAGLVKDTSVEEDSEKLCRSKLHRLEFGLDFCKCERACWRPVGGTQKFMDVSVVNLSDVDSSLSLSMTIKAKTRS